MTSQVSGPYCDSDIYKPDPGSRGGGGTPINYLYGYVPPKGVVNLERGIHFRGVF